MKVVGSVLLIYCLFVSIASDSSLETRWSYSVGDRLGPDNWEEVFKICGGERQSPINIVPTFQNPYLGELTFNKDYVESVGEKRLTNTGHTIELNVEESVALVYGDDGLFDDARYHLYAVDFRWGSDDSDGSEHAVDGMKFPLEIQLIHYDSERYDSYVWALQIPDAVFVFSVFAKVGPDDHLEIEKVFSHLSEVEYEGDTTIVEETIDFTKFLPSDRSFYKYYGSFTSPPCYEEVTWMVFKKSIYVSPDQMQRLRSLKNERGPLVNNFRPLQPLNNRVVYQSF